METPPLPIFRRSLPYPEMVSSHNPSEDSLYGSAAREQIARVVGPLLGTGLGQDKLPSELLEDLAIYLRLTMSWGARMDLTAPRSMEEFLDLSLADAALMAGVELERGRSTDRIIDVGTGGGAPGLPLAIVLSHLRDGPPVTFVEPRTKRVAFLRSTLGQLSKLIGHVRRGRSDALPGEEHDVALARATLPPSAWLSEGARLARSAVWVLLARDEAPQHPELSARVVREYEWPLTGVRRRALRYERNC